MDTYSYLGKKRNRTFSESSEENEETNNKRFKRNSGIPTLETVFNNKIEVGYNLPYRDLYCDPFFDKFVTNRFDWKNDGFYTYIKSPQLDHCYQIKEVDVAFIRSLLMKFQNIYEKTKVCKNDKIDEIRMAWNDLELADGARYIMNIKKIRALLSTCQVTKARYKTLFFALSI